MVSAWKATVLQVASDRPLVAACQRADEVDSFIAVIGVDDRCDDPAGASDCPSQTLRLLQVVTVKGILDQAELKQCGLLESTGECRCIAGEKLRWISVLGKVCNRQANGAVGT